MQLTPIIAIHMSAAMGAIALGPLALWTRQGRVQRPRLHRAFGYAWVTLMVATALSGLFIRDFRMPNVAGYTPIHMLVPVTLAGLFGAFYKLARRDIAGHREIMRKLYFGACIVAGLFTLLPGRYLGNLLWGRWLGLVPPDFELTADAFALPAWLAALPAWTWAVPAVAAIAFRVLRRRQPQAAL